MHFRNCAESAWEDVQAAVQATLAEQPELRVTRGRKVLELRPEVRPIIIRQPCSPWHHSHPLHRLAHTFRIASTAAGGADALGSIVPSSLLIAPFVLRWCTHACL